MKRAFLTVAILLLACDEEAGSPGAGSDASTVQDMTVYQDALSADANTADAFAVDATSVDASTLDATSADVQADASSRVTTMSGWKAGDGLPEDACVPWTLNNTSNPEAPVLAGGVLTLANNSNGEAMYYSHVAAVLAMPDILVIEAQMKFESGSSQGPSRSGADVAFSLDDNRKNLFFIGDDVIFLLSAENTRGPSYAAPTKDAMHTYRMEVNTKTGGITVFRDNVSVITGNTFVSPYAVARAISWGDASLIARATSVWGAVSHNALIPVACP